jgi:thioesterase domain-containing protein/acyl carrier protein
VPVTPGQLDLTQLRAALRSQLPPYMVPAVIHPIDSLPLTVNGKIDRKALAMTRADTGPARRPAASEPDGSLAGTLTAIWAKILDVPDVGVDDDFFDLGGNSVAAIRLMSQLRKRFEVELPIASLFEAPTIRQLAASIRSRDAARPSPLSTIQSGADARPLFLVHPIGGSVLCYGELARQLGFGQPVYGLSAIGLHEFVVPQDDIAEMAATYLNAILQKFPDGSFRLAGWSMGGVIAYEMAGQLRSQGFTPAPVLLIDSECPSAAAHHPPDDGTLRALFRQEQDHITGAAPGDANGSRLEQHDSELLYQVFRANFLALHDYRPQRAKTSVLLYSARSKPRDASWSASQGWDKVAETVSVQPIDADHRSILVQPSVSQLAELMRLDLAQGQD